MKRNIYLDTIPIDEALDRVRSALDREALVGVESVPVHEAAGRVTSHAVYAELSSPTYHSAAMDGIAVKAEATFGARDDKPLELIQGEGYIPVNTGNPLPAGMDAVIMIENVVPREEGRVSIEAPAFPWQHVRRIGEDIVATELLIPQNHVMSAYDVGALLSAGIWDVDCYERLKLHIIPTGDEVLDFETRPKPEPGQVVESNSQIFMSLAKAWGIDAVRVPPVPDKPEALGAAVQQALESDAHVVVIGAGSSAGAKDYSRATMERFGQVLVHGIKAMPGKPSLLTVANAEYGGKLIVGAPGYPVSAVVCFEELLAPLAAWMTRKFAKRRPKVEAELTRRVPSKLGMEEFLRLSIGKVGGKYVATPLGRGAGMITTLTRAQGMARIPANSEGVEAGQTVEAELLVPGAALDRILVAVGSHDNTLDLLADALMGLDHPIRLASTHVGSMGGLMAVKNGSCHMAGTHLFEPDAEDYNFPFTDRYLPGLDVTLVNLAIRHQGLIVAPGNPKDINSVQALAREDVRFLNRQRGAGTRILLDHHLQQAGIHSADVTGYDKEEFTHMAVAVNVLTGAADCGLGIMAAARALKLDFAPLARERYDLLIPTAFLDDPKVQAVLELIRTAEFKAGIMELGGYETTLTGLVMEPGMGLGV
ncbi:molybdopterin biosynthesis protein [Desulfovibrio ferrophilus]|uniref:Molybdopterin molybdenumtransferase n=1 Tax=Desulfovibrio ferrophilus TaxID=241368 RepID=A0A2Z6B1W2_9BACT|nr:molybdopterin biosynthesis protein [Desulfovibrio ferrophilus]BBD09471.1 molybdenum cofactor synthesis domain-containing protein [Desulfovibrio ferrophilus]